MPSSQPPDEPGRPPGLHAEWHDDFVISIIDDEEPEPFTCDVIAEADRKLEAAGLPSYTELAELLHNIISARSGCATQGRAEEAIARILQEVNLNAP